MNEERIISVRATAEQNAAIDRALRALRAARGEHVTRSDAVRAALAIGIEALTRQTEVAE